MFQNSLSIVFRYPRSFEQAIVSGEVKNAFHFTNELIKSSKKSTIVSFEEDQLENCVEESDNQVIIRISTPKSRGVIRYAVRIFRAYKYCRANIKSEFDVVHSHITYGSFLAVILGYRRKLITTPHGTNFQEIQTELSNSFRDRLRKLNAHVQRQLDTMAMNLSLMNVTVSKYQIKDMKDCYKCKRPIVLAYNGVPKYYKNTLDVKIYDGLFVGRACKKKGLDKFLQLALAHPDKKFKMILGDKIFTTLEDDFMSKLENCSNIETAYELSEHDLVRNLNMSKVLVVPSRGYESLPTVIMEAIACKTTVISTLAWGNPEVILNKNLMFIEDSFESINTSFKNALKTGFKECDYSEKRLEIEHKKIITAFKELYK